MTWGTGSAPNGFIVYLVFVFVKKREREREIGTNFCCYGLHRRFRRAVCGSRTTVWFRLAYRIKETCNSLIVYLQTILIINR
jgi:hypothetical protein